MKIDLPLKAYLPSTPRQKALLFTLLAAGIVVLSAVNLGLELHQLPTFEIHYKPLPEQKASEKSENLYRHTASESRTNEAYNETMPGTNAKQAYRPIPPPPREPATNAKTHTMGNKRLNRTSTSVLETSGIGKKERQSLGKVTALLRQQQINRNNTRGNISFSVVGRKKVYIPIPVYLCEEGGKVIVTIAIDAKGHVVNAYINGASATTNKCLTTHALKYAKASLFSASSSKKEQLGTITFHFIAKN